MKNRQKRLTNECSCATIILTHYEFMCCAVRKGAVGREDFARLFVPLCGIGQVELLSFTIELLLGVAIPRRALKSLKKRDFNVGFVVVRFFR